MKYRKLGKNGLEVSAIGLGSMGISEVYGRGDKEVGKKVIQEAYARGVNFFDTADMYGKGENEILLGEAISGFRNKIVLASKCALQFEKEGNISVTNDPAYIKNACQASLKRLNVERIDLYYLHRYTPDVPIEDSMGAMQSLIEEGKIGYVGLSEVSSEILLRAHAVLGDKLVALQSEYSLLNPAQAEAMLPVCRNIGVGFVAYSPIGRGLLSNMHKNVEDFAEDKGFDFRRTLPQFQVDALPKNLELVQALADFAKTKNCSAAQLSLAWLLAQGDDIIPIPGTKKIPYLLENIAAVDIELSKEDLKTIASILKEHPVKGARYPEQLFKSFHMQK